MRVGLYNKHKLTSWTHTAVQIYFYVHTYDYNDWNSLFSLVASTCVFKAVKKRWIEREWEGERERERDDSDEFIQA